MRWRLRLSEFNFEIRNEKEITNTQADALSRLKTSGETVPDIDEVIPCFLLGPKQILGTPVPPLDGSSAENEQEFLDLDFAYTDALLAVEEEHPLLDMLAPISIEELVRSEASDFNICRLLRYSQELRQMCAEPYQIADEEEFPEAFFRRRTLSNMFQSICWANRSRHRGKTGSCF